MQHKHSPRMFPLHTPTRVCTRRCAPSAKGWRRSEWAREAESFFGEQETDGKPRQKHPTETDTQESPGKQLGYFQGPAFCPSPSALPEVYLYYFLIFTVKQLTKKSKTEALAGFAKTAQGEHARTGGLSIMMHFQTSRIKYTDVFPGGASSGSTSRLVPLFISLKPGSI